MSQPTTYNRFFSFSDYQAGNPSLPLPGGNIDTELNLVKQTLDEILTNLAIIQQDDTEIMAGSIGYDQLADEVAIGLEVPTTWATLTAYTVGDTVFNAYVFYRCLVAHTSGTFATDLAAVKWVLIADFSVAFADAITAVDAAADALASEVAAAASASTASTAASTASAAQVTASAAAVSATASEAAALAYSARYKGTSVSSVAIGTGSKSFTTQAGKNFDVGVWVEIHSDADIADFMHGQVTSYSGTALIVNVTNVGGSGTDADWTITVSGTRGAVGATGASGPGSGDMVAANNLSDVVTPATARTNLQLGTGNSPEFAAVNIGAAADTTITRAGAGRIAVEGSNVLMASDLGVDVLGYDADLVDIALLAPSNDDIIQRKAGVWSKRTIAQLLVDILAADAELTALAALTSAANKIPMFSGSGTASLLDFKDEDTMVSDSATALPSQQSVKAYADTKSPVPTTSTFPIGVPAICVYTSTTALADGATTAGTNLKLAVKDNGSGSWPGGATQTGTWRNISGVTLDANGLYEAGYFIRIS